MFINSFKNLIKNIFDCEDSDDYISDDYISDDYISDDYDYLKNQTNTHEIIEKLNNIKIKKKVRFNI